MNQVAAAVAFVWLGMVLAISFLEAPLKFRAPNVTIPIGLGIGRLVFRALNTMEVVFALTVLALALGGEAGSAPLAAVATATAILGIQLGAIRPRLTQRSDMVIAGENPPPSRLHYTYIALETLKVLALLVTGALLLQT